MNYTPRYKDELVDQLYRAILKIETFEECQRFFDDLCTISELQSLSQRLAVAAMLKRGETYATIERLTGASTATISRINKSLTSESKGYHTILDRLMD